MASRALLLLAFGLVGCEDETALVLSLGGDLRPGVDYDSVELTLWSQGAQLSADERAVGQDETMPLSFELRPASQGGFAVELLVETSVGGEAVIEARREVSFVRGERVPVEMCLWAACVGSETDRCRRGDCAGVSDGGDAGIDADADSPSPSGCTNDCPFSGDGRCDDGASGSDRRLCDHGTDCADCGERDPEACSPSCGDRRCGSDGCGGTCGRGCDEGDRCLPGGQCVRWAEIPAQSFTMGSPAGEPGREPDEIEHAVVLTRGFEIGAHEVTQRWYAQVVGRNPAYLDDCGELCPVETVSWFSAAAFLNDLSTAEGLAPCYACSGTGPSMSCSLAHGVTSPYECEGYRLPTEAEWELAARGGTEEATYNGDVPATQLGCEGPNPVLDAIAWYCGNTATTHSVGELAPNGLGLYDTLGNVREWLHDWHEAYPNGPVTDPFGAAEGSHRVIRGGGTSTRRARSERGIGTTERRRRRPRGSGFAWLGLYPSSSGYPAASEERVESLHSTKRARAMRPASASISSLTSSKAPRSSSSK